MAAKSAASRRERKQRREFERRAAAIPQPSTAELVERVLDRPAVVVAEPQPEAVPVVEAPAVEVVEPGTPAFEMLMQAHRLENHRRLVGSPEEERQARERLRRIWARNERMRN